jgi:hypothetical protein
MKQCSFTIVAKNYIGLGKILEKSLRQHAPNVDFFIFVADSFDGLQPELPMNVIICKNVLKYSNSQWIDMAFKYDLTEFCTAIKPACFQYLFSTGYEQAIYFDPDIFIFSSIEKIYIQLETYDVVLTPQIAGIHIDYSGEHPEWAMNVNGIFNLGFCGMRRTSLTKNILAWWRKRLEDNSFKDRSTGNFTDQKWMDWMPGFLGNEHLYVFHDLGMNMAPWNFFERELFKDGDNLMVKYRTNDNPQQEAPLIFMHFAGYDYQKMKQGIISRKRIENLQEYEDLKLATNIYCQAIVCQQQLFDSYIKQTYSYGHFDNGKSIESFHRRLYHGLTENSFMFTNPFSVENGSYFDLIQKKGMIGHNGTDRLNQRNISGLDKKRRMVAMLFKSLYWIMGYKRYVLFLKSLYFYCRPELHTFLIRK